MRAFGLLLLAVWCTLAANAEPRVNPFSRPADARSPAALVASAPDRLEVRGILWAGRKSLVNVNGTIIGLGEEAFGYVLADVEEESATLVKDDEAVTLSVIDSIRGGNDD